jgi:hypothetical protein
MGQLFSRTFCQPSELLRDSERMRRRLGAFSDSKLMDQAFAISRIVEQETGSRVPWIGSRVHLDAFFHRAELRDVLDTITIIDALLRNTVLGSQWHSFVARVFQEEHTAYTLEKDGSVSFAVDAAYAGARASTIAGLSEDKWTTSRTELERAFADLDEVPANTNSAIRTIGASVESAAKVVVHDAASSIGPTEIEKHIWPRAQVAYAGNPAARDASHQFLRSYSDWVVCTHQYRHGQSHEAAAHAPLELAIAVVSQGCSILRWLSSLDELVERSSGAGSA